MKKRINHYEPRRRRKCCIAYNICNKPFGLLLIITLLLAMTGNSFAANDTGTFTLNRTTKPPLSNPEQNGFVDQVVNEALSRIGVKMKTIVLPAERALRDANAGILDGELARVPGMEKTYKNLIFVPENLMNVEFIAFSIKHDKIEPGWDALKNSSVAFLNGWKILEKNVPTSTEITKVHSPNQLFELLRLNRVDYIIYEKWAGLALAKSMNLDNVHPLSPPLAVTYLHMYLNKKHQEQVEPLTKALKAMKADGTYQAIYQQTLEPFARSQ